MLCLTLKQKHVCDIIEMKQIVSHIIHYMWYHWTTAHYTVCDVIKIKHDMMCNSLCVIELKKFHYIS